PPPRDARGGPVPFPTVRSAQRQRGRARCDGDLDGHDARYRARSRGSYSAHAGPGCTDRDARPDAGAGQEKDTTNPKPGATPEAAGTTTAAAPTSTAPITLPAIKAINVHYDRDAEVGHIVGELLENN